MQKFKINFQRQSNSPDESVNKKIVVENISLLPEIQPFRLTKELIKERISKKPYFGAILNIRNIRTIESPIDKMRCIT